MGSAANGGDGGNATATVAIKLNADTAGISQNTVSVQAFGGNGGQGSGIGKHGGAGGIATVGAVTLYNTDLATTGVAINITQQAGFGGNGFGGASAGAGGASVLAKTFSFPGGAAASLTLTSVGGSGGSTYGSDGGPSTLVGASAPGAAGTSTLTVSAPLSVAYANSTAYGGNGGNTVGTGDGASGAAGAAGLSFSARTGSANVVAVGGNGGQGGGSIFDGSSLTLFAGNGGAGASGLTHVALTATATGMTTSASVEAFGGRGGDATGTGRSGGVGGLANVSDLDLTGEDVPGGTLNLSTYQRSGAGGTGNAGASGGNAPSSVIAFNNAFVQLTGVSIYHTVTAGDGGNTSHGIGSGLVGTPGTGGFASATLTVTSTGTSGTYGLGTYGGRGGSAYGTGNGRDGAQGLAALTASGASLNLNVSAQGGYGGDGGSVDSSGATPVIYAGNGGNGGPAVVSGSANALAGDSTAYYYAYGGGGGAGTGTGAHAGSGGTGTFPSLVSLSGPAGNTGSLVVSSSGGNGGYGSEGAAGGNGASATLSNAITGVAGPSGFLYLVQNATGGGGGFTDTGVPGLGGGASSILNFTALNAGGLGVYVSAFGGTGGSALGLAGTHAGLDGTTATAVARGASQSSGDAEATAIGGSGGLSFGSGLPGNGVAPALISSYMSGTTRVYSVATSFGGNGGASFSRPAGFGATVSLTNVADGDCPSELNIDQRAYGGSGGDSDQGGLGAAGAAGSSLSLTKSSDSFYLNSIAVGGAAGGRTTATSAAPVVGGAGTALAAGTNTFGSANITASSRGGAGSRGGNAGGTGGASISRADTFGPGTGPDLAHGSYAYAYGGDGGTPDTTLRDRTAGAGGLADTTAFLTVADSATYAYTGSYANGGRGGNESSGGETIAFARPALFPNGPLYTERPGLGGAGGNAIARTTLTGGQFTSATAQANGGTGGSGFPSGRGGDATALTTINPGTAVVSPYAGATASAGGPSAGGADSGDAVATAQLGTAAPAGAYLSAQASSSNPGFGLAATATGTAFAPEPALSRVAIRPSTVTILPSALTPGLGSMASAAMPTAFAATNALSGAPASVRTAFGNGTGMLTMGVLAATHAAPSDSGDANITFDHADGAAFDGLPLYLGLFNASGNAAPSPIDYLVAVDGTVVASGSYASGTGLVAGANNQLVVVRPAGSTVSFGGEVTVLLSVGAGSAGSFTGFSYAFGTAPVANQWFGGSNAVLNDSTRWTGGAVPSGSNVPAIFNDRFTSPGPVSVPTYRPIGLLDIDGAGYDGWRFEGDGSFGLLSTGTFEAGITLRRGTANIDVPVIANSDAHLRVGDGAALYLNADVSADSPSVSLYVAGLGDVHLSGNLSSTMPLRITGGSLILEPAGTIAPRVINTAVGSTTGVYGLYVRGDHALSSIAGATGTLGLDNFTTLSLTHPAVPIASPDGTLLLDQALVYVGGTSAIYSTERSTDPDTGLRVAKPFVYRIGTLDIPGTPLYYQGHINVTDNDLILTSTPVATATDLISGWYNFGNRNGNGIVSTVAGNGSLGAESLLTTLGVIENSDGAGNALYVTFDGIPVAATDVLVKYTYVGDTNLDGIVDGADLANLLAGMNGGLTGWVNGDTNYDGIVDDLDLTALLDTLGQATSSFAWSGGANSNAIPEPSSAAWLMSGVGLLGLRRQRRNPAHSACR